MSVNAFHDGEWRPVKSAYCFHEGIGFVRLYAIKIHAEGKWISVGLYDDQPVLIGA